MEKKRKIQEKFLYKVWQDQCFSKILSTSDGNTLQIIDPGAENKESDGPDFRNARIKIGNITFSGDVEIDNFYSDWKSHGHNFNKKYNKVILHVIFQNENHNNFVFTRDGRKIPTVGLGRFIKGSMKESLQRAVQKERNERLNKIPCKEVSIRADEKFKVDYIRELGIERYKKKCERILHRLKELVLLNELNLREPVVKYDIDQEFAARTFSYQDFSDKYLWEQLFYELIFEALGYTNNKDIMKKLACSADIKFFERNILSPDLLILIESVLFNISGLIPDHKPMSDEEVSVYVRQLAEKWDNVKPAYDGKKFRKSHWHFAGLRPPNFPNIRIAGGARLLQKILQKELLYKIFQKFEEAQTIGEITKYLRNNLIIKSEGFWQKHYQFDSPAKSPIKYFIGLSRVDDIIINVIFPVASVYFEIFGKENIGKKISGFYLVFSQKSENRLVNDLSEALALKNIQEKSVLHQGMISLYRNYCSKDKCLDCRIGEKVFN